MNPIIKWLIAVVGWIFLIIIFGIWKSLDKEIGTSAIVGGIRGGLFGCGIYFLYSWAKNNPKRKKFNTTQFVDSVAPAHCPSENKSATPMTQKYTKSVSPEHLSPSLLKIVVDEDRVYAEIGKELETIVADKGLWTRLFAESSGDEKQTKVLYIKQRAERLIAIERTRLSQLEHERAVKVEQLEKLKRQRDIRADPELVRAVWNGNWSTASKLLRDGVKPIGTDQDGNSLLELARKGQDQQMIQLLESYGAP